MNQKDSHFTILYTQVINKEEKKGLDKFFEMLLTLRQQIIMGSKKNTQ